MAGDWPRTDTRRAAGLREALERTVPALAPDWAGLQHEGDFGRALVEIAARLAEHSTRRLDQTALRDKLAFLDTLDVATPPPQPATVPIVFTLAEKKDDPVFAPARVQLTAEPAEKGGDEIPFETRDGIMLTPARLAALIAADPRADRIEAAPALVTGAVDAPRPQTQFRLLSAAEVGAGAIQLVQAVGIEPGDLLRIGALVYRVDKPDGAIVLLRDPLEAPAAAGEAVEKVVRLESFALRNLQAHEAYIGHKELLKLDGKAAITLVFDPPELARRLAGLDLEFHIWGTPKTPESGPGWQPLRASGAIDAGLTLNKDWEGSVEEVAAPGGTKSRWIRLRLLTPIAGACGPDTRAVSVKLKVQSETQAEQADGEQKGETREGSRTIVNAFHNGLPLSTSTSFFPFGPEPQRFDTFALAAPEALSKKGASVTLHVELSDASFDTMALATGDPSHIYGVDHGGRLQSIRFPGGKGWWRQLGPPSADGAAAAAGAGEGSARLGKSPLYAVAAPGAGLDLVFAMDRDKLIRVATVRTAGDLWSAASWQALPPPGEPFHAFCLIPSVSPILPHWLIAADGSRCYIRAVAASGVPTPEWRPLAADAGAPDLTPPIAIVAPVSSGAPPGSPGTATDAAAILAQINAELGNAPVPPEVRAMMAAQRAATLPTRIALVDAAGAIHEGTIIPDSATIAWRHLPSAYAADTSVQPAAVIDAARKLAVVAAARTEDKLIVVREDGELHGPPGAPEAITGKPESIFIEPGTKDPGSPLPLVVVSGGKGYFLWLSATEAYPRLMPSEVHPKGAHLALVRPGDASRGTPPTLLLNASDELVLHAPIKIDRLAVSIKERKDALWREPGTTPTHIRVGSGTTRPKKLTGGWISFAGRDAKPTAGMLTAGVGYRLLREGAEFTGARGKAADALSLSKSDTTTAVGDLVVIKDGGIFEVTGRNDAGTGRSIATLDAAIGGVEGDSVTYTGYTPTEAGRTASKADIGTLANIGDVAVPEWADELRFASPAKPAVQRFEEAGAQFGGDSWLFLGEAWATPPGQAKATFARGFEIDAWSQVRLPREADNPELSWEYFDGEGWRRLDRGLQDGTVNFARSGKIVFDVPSDLAPAEVAGKEDYWIRARLIGGDYGRPSYLVESSGTPPTTRQSITVDRSRLSPPEILSIEARYVLNDEVPPECVVIFNNLAAIDQTQAAAAEGARFDLFQGISEHVGDEDGGTRALYLGFSKALSDHPIGFYADAVDRNEAPRALVAEALRPNGWTEIRAEDETAGLTRPGLLQLFLGPLPARLPLFGRDGWWLRLRPKEQAAGWAPLLRGLYVNAVTAEQAKTVTQEILGSSLGEPDQVYQLAEKPVLADTLELRVRESLGDEEKAELERKAAPGKQVVAPEDPDLPGQWILWEQVDSFVDQDGNARVYRLNPGSGEMVFGNGREGKVPPAGPDAIRAFSYQAGGGSTGNVPALAVKQLKSAVESVESAVNPVDAGGGADAPKPAQIAGVAPALLRHARRALAPVDIEALTTGSAPDVVRARCLARKGCGIDLAVAIDIPNQRCPVPSRARREGIAANILAAGWGALAPGSVRVHPPRYLHVRVEAIVAPVSNDDAAEVFRDVRETLFAFLDPMRGGADGAGWPFGRRVWPSDLQRAIAEVRGVDRVLHLALAARDEGDRLEAMRPDALICADEDDIQVTVQPAEDGR